MSPTDCPSCGRTFRECSKFRAKGWDNCCLSCDEQGQVANHARLYVPDEATEEGDA